MVMEDFFIRRTGNPNIDKATFLTGPVPSIRLEMMRDGIEDYEYFSILEKAIKNAGGERSRIADDAVKMLNIPPPIYTNETTYSKYPHDILNYRKKIAEYIVAIGQK